MRKECGYVVYVTNFDVHLNASVYVHLGEECGYVGMWVKSQGLQINLNGSVYAHLGEECGGCVGLSHKVSKSI